MKLARIILSFATLVALAGCSANDPGSTPERASEALAPTVAPAPAPPPASAEVVPGEIPDRDTDPAGFWNWRVENMFLTRDADKDGAITREEFEGNPAEFGVIDADGDGGLEKNEVHDYVFARFVVAPESPRE